jgi:peroxiredoxin
MKKSLTITFVLLSFFISSCKNASEKKQVSIKIENLEPKVNLNELETDFIKWWTYHSNNISLASNFIGINETSNKIDKQHFLEALISGDFIPLKLKSKNGIEHYKLYKLDSLANKNIRNTIKSETLTTLKHYKMEGLKFPNFDFKDLNGNHYTNENTKGKITIFKTWFINCLACVAEFPELNELVEQYKNQSNILFLSLATDPKSDLENFLVKKMFDYKVVPNQKDFINNKLHLRSYPTHIIVDKNGTILKVVNKASELISFLKINLNNID